MKIVKDTSDVASKIRQLYKITEELEQEFPGSKFTPDGHMLRSIGEVLVADHYGLELLPNSAETHDAKTADGVLVQIKTTQGDRISLSSQPDKLIVIHIFSNGEWEEIYNSPGNAPWHFVTQKKPQKNGQRQISLAQLKQMMTDIPDSQKIPPRKRSPRAKRSLSPEEKASAYQDLIRRVKQAYSTERDGLIWCPACKEINLWTYWQGKGNLDAKIMLVGQDWGNPQQESAAEVMQRIADMNQKKTTSYLDSKPSPTDRNLTALFETLGYHINRNDPKNRELFFTNFVLGYRQGKISQDAKREWFKNDAPFFKELVSIIEPKVILCLGQITFKSVLRSLRSDEIPRIESYQDFIQSSRNPVVLTTETGHSFVIYALAHCGSFGTMNRNRGLPKQKDLLFYQKQDWEKIKASL